ncbi:MAG: hypothetical protein AAFY38_02880 [Pseudomonadota bacterium]
MGLKTLCAGVLAACVATVGLAGAATAQATLYDCQITKGGKAGTWISPRAVLIVENGGTARVVDGVTLAFVDGGAATARLRRSGASYRFDWNVSGAVDSMQQILPTFTYRATLDTATGTVRLSAKPARAPQRFSGSGTCTTRENISVRDLNRLLRG